jgi:hypothetical protein
VVFKGTTTYKAPANCWQVKWIGRLAVMLCLAVPFGLLLFFLSPEQIPNPYWLTLIGFLVPYTADAFLVFALTDYVSLRLGLLDRSDCDSTTDEDSYPYQAIKDQEIAQINTSN